MAALPECAWVTKVTSSPGLLSQSTPFALIDPRAPIMARFFFGIRDDKSPESKWHDGFMVVWLTVITVGVVIHVVDYNVFDYLKNYK